MSFLEKFHCRPGHPGDAQRRIDIPLALQPLTNTSAESINIAPPERTGAKLQSRSRSIRRVIRT